MLHVTVMLVLILGLAGPFLLPHDDDSNENHGLDNICNFNPETSSSGVVNVPSEYSYWDFNLISNYPDQGWFGIDISFESGWRYVWEPLYYEEDYDEDGLTNYDEWFVYQSYPMDPNYDDDGFNDGAELYYHHNPFDNEGADLDGDGVLNCAEWHARTLPRDPDTDNDGLTDGQEINTYATDPLHPDPDGDGLSDIGEVYSLTDPFNNDTDGDGMTDGWESEYYMNPLEDDSIEDDDEDGLTAIEEFLHGTNPREEDTDGDTLLDGMEIYEFHTNPLQIDSDGDGVSDATEIQQGTDPLSMGDNLKTRACVIVAIISIIGLVIGTILFNIRQKRQRLKIEASRRELLKARSRYFKEKSEMYSEGWLEEKRRRQRHDLPPLRNYESYRYEGIRKSPARKRASHATVKREEPKTEQKTASQAPSTKVRDRGKFAPKANDDTVVVTKAVVRDYLKDKKAENETCVHFMKIKSDLGVISKRKEKKLRKILEQLVKFVRREKSTYVIII